MKRSKLIKLLVAKGCRLKRHGKKHDIFVNNRNGRKAPIPRHNDISKSLCMLIKKQLGIEN